MRITRFALIGLFLLPACLAHAQASPAPAAAQSAPSQAPKTRYIPANAVDLKATLPDPPANDSSITRTEIANILSLQASRQPDQIARAKSEETLTVWSFAPVLGDSFTAGRLPVTAGLLNQVEADTRAITDNAKKFWSRPRPYELDARIVPCVAKPANAAYPSGHTSRAFSWAIVLSELYPHKKAQLLARAQEIGDDRVLAGVHYDTDVDAGKALGVLIGRKILASAQFQADLVEARNEIAARK